MDLNPEQTALSSGTDARLFVLLCLTFSDGTCLNIFLNFSGNKNINEKQLGVSV